MAAALGGFGTRFYGKRDVLADGSYITTEWIIFIHVPIAPLRSFRVRYEGRGDPPRFRILPLYGWSDRFTVLERMRPHWKQVLYIYGYCCLYFLWIKFLVTPGHRIDHFFQSMFSREVSDYLVASVIIFGIAAPAVVPAILRGLARRKEHTAKP